MTLNSGNGNYIKFFNIYFTAAFEESIGNGDAARQILNKLLEQYPLLIGNFLKNFLFFEMILE